MKEAERNRRTRALILAVQTAESEAHALGLHVAGHALNNAKNALGWNVAREVEQAGRAPITLAPIPSWKET